MNLIIWVFSILILPFSAVAEKKLSWQDCVNLTKENNPDYKSNQSTYKSTQALESAALGSFYPQISAQIGERQSNLLASATTYSTSLSATLNLFNGMSDFEKLMQAYANTENAVATLKINNAKLSHTLVSVYQKFLSAIESEKLAQEIKNRRQNNLRLIELRFQSGRENKGSVLLSQANLKQAQLDLMIASHNIKTSNFDLLQVLGLDPAEVVSVLDEIPMLTERQVEPNFLLLAQNNPEYLQTIASEKVAVALVNQQKSSFYPTLNLAGTVGKQDQFFMPNTNSWSTSLTLSIPLFSGGKDFYTYRSTFEKYQAAMQTKISTHRKLYVSLQETFHSYQEAVEKMKVDEAFKEAAILRAEIARNQYNNGLISFQEWDLIENDLILRQRNFLESKKQRVLQESLWRQALGEGVL